MRNWVDGIVRGNQLAFRSLYGEFAPRLYGYFRLRIHREADIQDVMQDVFVTIWQNASQYQGLSSVSTWVFGIARHKLLDWSRRMYRYGQQSEYQLDEIEGVPEVTTADFSDQMITRLTITSALEKIPAHYAEIIYLVFHASLRYKEISVLLEIPEGTVKSRMHQAKTLLQKAFHKGVGSYDR